MPNWVSNRVAIKGEENKVKNFLKVAFKHINGEMPEDLEEAVHSLNRYNDEYRYEDNAPIVRLGTWKPVPEDFELDKDTTNYPDQYPELVKYQKEKYGCVGWYEFNLMWFGCKWDSSIDHFSLESYDDGLVALFLTIDTPWSEPFPWLNTLQQKYRDLVFFNCSSEESGMFYHYYDLINQEPEEYDVDGYIADYEAEEGEDEYDISNECTYSCIEDLQNDFSKFVAEFDINELENLPDNNEDEE